MQHQRSDARGLIAADAIGDQLGCADEARAERSGGNKGDAVGLAVFLKLIGEVDRLVRRIGADDMTRHAEIDIAAVALRAPFSYR